MIRTLGLALSLLPCFARASASPVPAGDSLVAASIARGYWSAGEDSLNLGEILRGPLYRVRSVTVTDERGRAPEGFSVGEWAGEPASRSSLEKLQNSLRDYYLDHGFPFAEVVARPRADSAGLPLVDIEFRVNRGSSYKRGEARLVGTRSRPETVRRLALWERDEDFSQALTLKGLERLRRTGYYETVDWTGLYRDPDRNVLYPVLTMPDAPANSVGGLLGFDSKGSDAAGGPGGGKLTGYLDVRLVNLFGTARDFSFSFDDRSGYEREIQGAYTEPWLFNLPLGARLEGSFLQQDTLFWEWNQSVTFFRDLSFISRIETEFGSQANHQADPGGGSGVGSTALRSGLRLTFDTRDRVLFTRSGYRSLLGVTGLRRRFTQAGSDSSYFLTQAQASLETWVPLSSRIGLALSARAASNFPLGRFNHGELYYIGGARSLRGYREREFQTNAYLLGEGQIQYWVGRRASLFAFAAPGLVNRLVNRYDGRKVLGYGVGIELSQGDWNLSLAYALNPDRRPGDGLLHVAVENRF